MMQLDAQIEAHPQYVRITGGLLAGTQQVARWRDSFSTAKPMEPATFVLELSAAVEAQSLEDLIVPLAQKIKNGHYGSARLIVCTPDSRLRNLIAGIAAVHGLSFFIAASSASLNEAVPIGGPTPTEIQSLRLLQDLGGYASASTFAHKAGIELTAAGNRLSNLEKRGFVHRLKRPGREGDIFLDPRLVSVRDNAT